MDLIKKVQAFLLCQRDARAIKNNGYPVVRLGEGAGRPRGLLMYLSQPLTWKGNDPRLDWHENLRQSCQIAAVMVECGYQVDVVDMNDKKFVPQEEYALFVGHGSNAAKLAKGFGKTTRKICLATGQYGPYANNNVEKRYVELEQRRNVTLKRRMPSGVGSEHYKGYDEIACFGTQYTADTFSALDMPVHPFPNYANPNIMHLQRDFGIARSGFLYTAAARHVLKGLDLLIEVFSQRPDLRLYIMGRLDPELVATYQEELSKSQNIKLCGYVRMGGSVWASHCARSAWYISPSASESMQGTALNAMAAGLIPIISRDVDVDIEDVGFRLNRCDLSEIHSLIGQLQVKDAGTIAFLSRASVELVAQKYAPGNFEDAWRKIIQNLKEPHP